ncbi:MAG: EfeM/EfeO family lipoprotein, partial [Actinobacteria bacterium]|nr:EfeM/EfeO family lipoprotein [Actinomycetota bacterium]
MFHPTTRRLAVALVAAGLLVGGCAKDDGASTRDDCTSGSSAAGGSSASGGSSAAGGASPDCGSGITADEVAGTSDDPLVNEAVDGYQQYVEEQVNALVDDAKVFTDAVRAGDIEAAKDAYPRSRQSWERIEPIAALISDIDGAVDSRAEEGVADTESPDVTGWHQLEYDL